MTLFIGEPLVVLNSTEAIYEAFVKNADHMSDHSSGNNPVFILTGGTDKYQTRYNLAFLIFPPDIQEHNGKCVSVVFSSSRLDK